MTQKKPNHSPGSEGRDPAPRSADGTGASPQAANSASFSAPHPGGADPYSLDDYWLAVYRRKWIVLLLVAASIAAAVVLTKRLETQYEALAEFYVPQDAVGPVPGPEAGKLRMSSGIKDHARVQVALLKTQKTKRAVAEKFPDKTAADFNRDVDFVVTPEASIRIFARDSDPETAALVANAFVEHFEQFHTEVVERDILRSLEGIEGQLTELGDFKREAEDEKEKFQTDLNVASLSTKLIELESQRTRFESRFQDAEIDRQVAEERIKALEEQQKLEVDAYSAGEIILQSPVITTLEQTLTQLELERAGLANDLKEDHPDVVALRERQTTAEAALKREIQRVVDSKSKTAGSLYENLRLQLTTAYVTYRTAAARSAGLSAVISGLNESIAAVPNQVTALSRLEDRILRYEAQIRKLRQTKDTMTAQLLTLSDVVLVTEEAMAPSKPIFPILPLNVGVAGFGGLVVGVLYAFLLDHLSRRRLRHRWRQWQRAEWAREFAADGSEGAS